MDQQTRPGAGVDLLLTVWSRRRWLAVVAFAVPLAVSGSVLGSLPSLYRSTATVLVDRQQVPEEFVRPTVTSALETRLHTISQEILSRSRLEGLIARFGLYADLRKHVSPEEVIERMRQDIRLELKGVEAKERRATIAFAISYWGGNPQTVAQVTNTLASFYIEENLKVRERQATGTADFLRVQLEETKKRLDEQEKRVSEFKKRYVGELPQEMDVNLATLERLNAQLRLNSDSQTRALERREALSRQMVEAGLVSPTAGAPATSVAPADPNTARLGRLRQELIELRTRFSDRYPDVVRVKTEIAVLEEQIASGKLAPNAAEAPRLVPVDPQFLRMKQAVSEVEAEVKILKAEETRLRAAIAEYQRRVHETPRREQEYRELARDYEGTKELYASLLKRHAEAQIAESMEQRQKGEQFRVLDPAVPAAEPVAPNRGRLLAMGLALSLGLAVGAVVLAEQLDTSFHTLDDLRRATTAPVLGSIPLIVTGRDAARRRRRFWLGVLAVLAALVILAAAGYLVAHGNERLVGWLAAGRA